MGRRLDTGGPGQRGILGLQALVQVYRVHLRQQLPGSDRLPYIDMHAQYTPCHRGAHQPALASFNTANAEHRGGQDFAFDLCHCDFGRGEWSYAGRHESQSRDHDRHTGCDQDLPRVDFEEFHRRFLGQGQDLAIRPAS